MKLARKALVHFSFLGLRFILNCKFLAGERYRGVGLIYVLVAFCYKVRQLGSKRRMIHETVHLQNLNCLASLRTKVMPVQISSERNWRKSWHMYPSRDRQDANRSNLARTLEPQLCCSINGGTNKFRLACSRRRGFIQNFKASPGNFVRLLVQDPERKIMSPALALFRLAVHLRANSTSPPPQLNFSRVLHQLLPVSRLAMQ